MDKPEHLRRFPCMYPWIGPKYKSSERRLAIVGESHYLPPCVTDKNYDPEKWYAARQEDVPDEKDAHSWMNTQTCVENRHGGHNRTYQTIRTCRIIEEVLTPYGLSFDDIAFFNYVFRPWEKGKPGFSRPEKPCKQFIIHDEDKKVSRTIMDWFIWKYQPTAIVIAFITLRKYTSVESDLAAHQHKIETCMTCVPTSNSKRFSKEVQEFLTGWDTGGRKDGQRRRR